MSLRFVLPLLAALTLLVTTAAQAVTYYVDPVNGRDTYNGQSATVSGTTGPWQTIGKVEGFALQPNDRVLFKAGSVFTNGLRITRSGSASLGRITFGKYGSGSLPIFKKGTSVTSGYASAIEITGKYIILDGLSGRDVHYCGVLLTSTASHVTIKNCYFTNVGIGVRYEDSSDNIMEFNTVESLHMIINNTATGGGNGDYGANGVWLEGNCSRNTITNNKFIKCDAPSFDFGRDGGALEIGLYREGVISSDNLFTKNRVEDCNSVVEVGGREIYPSTVRRLRVAYNVCYRNGYFLVLHTNGTRTYDDILINYNTVVEPDAFLRGKILITADAVGIPDYREMTLHNNIFYVGGNYTKIVDKLQFTHYNNDYYRVNPQFTQYGLTNATINGNIDQNPLFIRFVVGDDFLEQNFRLQSGSPAAGRGAYVSGGYTLN